MKIIVEKPPIPILWLDTWFILNLTKDLNGSGETKNKAEEIVEKIMSLTKQKKLLCPEGDQGMEIEVSNDRNLVENAQKLQARLSMGISLHYYKTVENLQVQRMMEAFLGRKTKLIFPWRDLFFRDPIEELKNTSPYIITVLTNPKRKELDKRIKTNKSISSAWEKMRKKALKNKQSYDTALNLEFGGTAEAMAHYLSFFMAKAIHKKRIFIKDILSLDSLIAQPLSWWKRYGGKEDDIINLLRFYKSEEYKKIPIIEIKTKLMAELVTGNEKISQSDVMDMHHIATVMPFAEYMLLDKRMKDRVENRLKIHRIYPCKLISQKELLPLLNDLT